MAPNEYERKGELSRTVWTAIGLVAYEKWKREEFKRSQGYEHTQIILRPSRHFVVVEPCDDTYFTFPDHPQQLSVFRNAWVLVRNKRPHVPVLEGTRLPSALQRPQDYAKYCSVFFRPWTC